MLVTVNQVSRLQHFVTGESGRIGMGSTDTGADEYGWVMGTGMGMGMGRVR
jgi:hypothetical protein